MNIATLVKAEFQKYGIPWQNCLAFGTDSANVMIGRKKGVFAYLKNEQDKLYLAACPAHLIHHAAEHATSALPFPIDEILIDLYHFLDKSSKRLSRLQKFQEMYEVDHQNITKHVATRWLSLLPTLNRVLENWDALRDFFKEEWDGITKKSTAPPRLERLKAFFSAGTNRVYCLFLQYALPLFHNFNEKIQTESPQIHLLRELLVRLLSDIHAHFVKPSSRCGKEVIDVTITLEDQVADAELMIGSNAKEFIAQKTDLKLFDESKKVAFFNNVRNFFCRSCDYIVKKLPLQNELLAKAEVVNFKKRLNSQVSDLTYFITRFPCLLPTGVSPDDLELQFRNYQVCSFPDSIEKVREKS